MKSEHKCSYCNKTFVRENSLINHMCEKKRRYLWKDEKYIKLGFIMFQKVHASTGRAKSRLKTYDQFVESRYYTSFTKFGRHVLNAEIPEPEGFMDFLIKANVKERDWCSDWVYETWINELSRKESPDRSIERTFVLMKKWASETDEDWVDFFRKVNPIMAVKWIKTGKLSPWLLYSGFGNNLFERMSDEQMAIAAKAIDPTFWAKKIALNKDEVSHFKLILKDVGF